MTSLRSLPKQVTIVEVGPRDGLQNEAAQLPVDVKVAFVRALAAAGLPLVEAGAFVHPQAVPQMAGSDEVFRVLSRESSVPPQSHSNPKLKTPRLVALVPNERGYERARAAGAAEVAVFTAASETFSQRNNNCSIAESSTRLDAVLARAHAEGVPVRAYVSTAWHCPYEGRVGAATVERITGHLLDGGAWQVSLGDTIGAATPREVMALLERLLGHTPAEQLALHLHDTRGTALANVLAALQLGITTVDASAGGLGGCPFAPGAAGNLATEDLVYLLDGLGIHTGVSLTGVAAASALIEPHLGHPLPGRAYQALKGTGGVRR